MQQACLHQVPYIERPPIFSQLVNPLLVQVLLLIEFDLLNSLGNAMSASLGMSGALGKKTSFSLTGTLNKTGSLATIFAVTKLLTGGLECQRSLDRKDLHQPDRGCLWIRRAS